MTVPDFQSVMLPLLQLMSDDRERNTAQYVSALAEHFNLGPEELRQMLPSGRQGLFHNRVAWAATHLAKAGLLQRTGRGRIRITARGHDVLRENLDRITLRYLTRFPEFVEFRTARPAHPASAKHREPSAAPLPETLSPDEQLESSYQQVRTSLARDLLDRIKAAPPAFFEQLVIDLLVAMGYGGSRADAGQAVGGSGDGGIDGIIKEDRLGLDFVYLQAKRWEGTVSRPVVQAFAGSLEGQRARKGVLITTSQFSRDAEDYVQRIEKRIVLIDGQQLAQYMLDFGIGVTEVATYTVQRVDLDYFGED